MGYDELIEKFISEIQKSERGTIDEYVAALGKVIEELQELRELAQSDLYR